LRFLLAKGETALDYFEEFLSGVGPAPCSVLWA